MLNYVSEMDSRKRRSPVNSLARKVRADIGRFLMSDGIVAELSYPGVKSEKLINSVRSTLAYDQIYRVKAAKRGEKVYLIKE